MVRYYFTTFTVTIASPAVFSATEHGLEEGDEVELETTGALPTGLLASSATLRTKYYVLRNGLAANAFQLSANRGGTAITTTGSQSGTHTFLKVNRSRLSPRVDSCR